MVKLYTVLICIWTVLSNLKVILVQIFLKMSKSAYESFKNIVDLALKQEVDFIIIAGDLFDSENRTLRAEVF